MYQRMDELWYYDIYPKVVPVGVPVTITVRALSGHVAFPADLQVKIQSLNPPDGDNNFEGEPCPAEVSPFVFRFTRTFDDEQEYHVRFPDPKGRLVRLRIYALEADLWKLRPLIGDFHSHSNGSDGKEDPTFVPARYCEEGYDFMTLTDHYRYSSSVDARTAYQDLPIHFQIYPGEECHPQDSPVHIVNFGSESPVNVEYFHAEEIPPKGYANPIRYRSDWKERVRKIQDTLPPLPRGIDPYLHSASLLICQLIREKGGMAILCHPHWMHGTSRNVPDVFSRYWVENRLADAYEVISGQSLRENMTQLALYQELRSEGCRIPAVSSSDSHGTCNTYFGEIPDQYPVFTVERTMVFAESNTKDSIIEAVKDLRSVLLEQYEGEQCRIHGPYRLVQYALFLIREYYPLRDYLCREQGQLMMRYSTGEPETAQAILAVDEKLENLRKKYFWQEESHT